MKIAHVVCSLNPGGAEKLASELALSLHQKGHDVEVIIIDKYTHCEYEQGMLDKFTNCGIRVHSLKRRPGSGYMVAGPVARFVKLIIRQRYDIVHSHQRLSHGFVGLAKLTSPVEFKHLLTIHSTNEKWSKLTSMLIRNVTIVFCSNAAADTARFSSHKHVIPNGVKPPDNGYQGTNAIRLRNSLGIPADAVMLISVGGIRKVKNYSKAVETVALLHTKRPEADFHYVICGAGPEEGALRRKSKSLSLEDRIHLLGDRSDVTELLKVADCFISMSLYEGLPLSVLEALFSGIKCVLSPIREHRDISGSMAGCVLASDKTVQSMAEAVLDIMMQKQSREELVKLRKPGLEQFSLETCVKSYEYLYRSLI